MVERQRRAGLDAALDLDDAAGHPLLLLRRPHPQTQGKVERFHGALERAAPGRTRRAGSIRPGWTAFARIQPGAPHEALANNARPADGSQPTPL